MNTFILIILSGFAVIGMWTTAEYIIRRISKLDIYSGCTLNVEVDQNENIDYKLYALQTALYDANLGEIPIVVCEKEKADIKSE